MREFLERDLRPTLSADRWFQCKVAINSRGMVTRELTLGRTLDEEERQRLIELRGEDGSLEEVKRRLAQQIRAGAIDAERPDPIAHLRPTMRDTLRINNPKWLDDLRP